MTVFTARPDSGAAAGAPAPGGRDSTQRPARGRRAGHRALLLPAIALLLGAAAVASAAQRPVPLTAVRVDSLIRPGETHFAELWQLTFGGENAEAYWSADGCRIVFQAVRGDWPCDQMYVMDLASGGVREVSGNIGRCTCGYFYDRDRRILYASTRLAGDSCPPAPDHSHGYVWPVYPGYDLFTAKPDGSDLRRLTDTPGYDAEATLSVDGRWIVFTSERDGDLDIYKMRPDGSAVARLTSEPGYDGGPFFSRDGRWICYRAFHPADSALAEFRGLLARHLVRPTHMDLWVMRADGSGQRQVTHDPGASFAPYFTPDGRAILYSSNRDDPRGRNFDVYLVPLDPPGPPQPVTRDPLFDGFPMFSPDGRWLLFESNRGPGTPEQRGAAAHETNIFLARWRR